MAAISKIKVEGVEHEIALPNVHIGTNNSNKNIEIYLGKSATYGGDVGIEIHKNVRICEGVEIGTNVTGKTVTIGDGVHIGGNGRPIKLLWNNSGEFEIQNSTEPDMNIRLSSVILQSGCSGSIRLSESTYDQYGYNIGTNVIQEFSDGISLRIGSDSYAEGSPLSISPCGALYIDTIEMIHSLQRAGFRGAGSVNLSSDSGLVLECGNCLGIKLKEASGLYIDGNCGLTVQLSPESGLKLECGSLSVDIKALKPMLGL